MNRFHSSLLLCLVAAGLAPVAAQTPTRTPAAPVQQGRDLYLGRAPLQNGGPPCGSCHQIAGIGFPNGGLMGPDLSGVSDTLGPDGLDVTLQTLFFPTMMPLYDQRPLTATEQQALKAFLQQAGATPVGPQNTLLLAALAGAGFILLVAGTWLAWRHRLRGVRAPLVRLVQSGGVRS